MKYRIKIFYQTGDSYSNEDETSYLELEWNNLEVAKENLRRITEHYEMYKDLEKNGRYSQKRTEKEWFELNKGKDWFVNKSKLVRISTNCTIDEEYKHMVPSDDLEYRPDWYYALHTLKLVTDDGVTMQMGAYWCGYFERLYEASIEINDDDMKVKF